MKHVEPKPYKAFKIDKTKFDANSHLILVFFLLYFCQKLCALRPVIQVMNG